MRAVILHPTCYFILFTFHLLILDAYPEAVDCSVWFNSSVFGHNLMQFTKTSKPQLDQMTGFKMLIGCFIIKVFTSEWEKAFGNRFPTVQPTYIRCGLFHFFISLSNKQVSLGQVKVFEVISSVNPPHVVEEASKRIHKQNNSVGETAGL